MRTIQESIAVLERWRKENIRNKVRAWWELNLPDIPRQFGAMVRVRVRCPMLNINDWSEGVSIKSALDKAASELEKEKVK